MFKLGLKLRIPGEFRWSWYNLAVTLRITGRSTNIDERERTRERRKFLQTGAGALGSGDSLKHSAISAGILISIYLTNQDDLRTVGPEELDWKALAHERASRSHAIR